MSLPNGPSGHQIAVLALLNRYGYRLVPGHLKPLMQHLSNLDRRDNPWTTDYLIAVAKGQLKASKRLLNAIDRCMRFWSPPDPEANEYGLPSTRCDCGAVFVPNTPWRVHCYRCRRPRIGKGSPKDVPQAS